MNMNSSASSVLLLIFVSLLACNKGNALSVNDRRAFLRHASATPVAIFFPAVVSAEDNVSPGGKIQYGDESIMSPKNHGES